MTCKENGQSDMEKKKQLHIEKGPFVQPNLLIRKTWFGIITKITGDSL